MRKPRSQAWEDESVVRVLGLLHSYEDLSWLLSTHVDPRAAIYACNPRTEEEGIGGTLGLTGQSVCSNQASSRFSEKPCLRK